MREVTAIASTKRVDSTAFVSNIVTAEISPKHKVHILQVPIRRGPPGPPGVGVLVPWQVSDW